MEIEQYDITDSRLFRIYEKSHLINYDSFTVLENVLSTEQLDHINLILEKYINGDSYVTQDKITLLEKTPLRCKTITDSIPQFDFYDQIIIDRCLEENSLRWNLDITGFIKRRHLIYDIDDQTVWHQDGPFGISSLIPDNLLWRKLSATVCLNDDYDGGEFEMIISSDPSTSYIKIKPSKGSIILFPPFIKHRVAPIKSGTRKSLIYWFCGPRWK